MANTKAKAKAAGKAASADTVKVYAPNQAKTGVLAGVAFRNGVAEIPADDRHLIASFRARGYGIGERRPRADATPPEPAIDARSAATSAVVGTRLRDAAVDPRTADFLPPTNAGEADPHGPKVVAPGIHAAPPTPITGGDVHVDEPAAQEAEQTEAATEALVEGLPVTEADEPKKPRGSKG